MRSIDSERKTELHPLQRSDKKNPLPFQHYIRVMGSEGGVTYLQHVMSHGPQIRLR